MNRTFFRINYITARITCVPISKGANLIHFMKWGEIHFTSIIRIKIKRK